MKAGSDPQAEGFLDENEWAVATWVFEHGEVAGRWTDTLGGASGLYFPLRTEEGSRGVLGVRLNSKRSYLQPEQRRILEAFAGLAAMARHQGPAGGPGQGGPPAGRVGTPAHSPF